MSIRNLLGWIVEDRRRRDGVSVPYVKDFDGWNKEKKEIAKRRVPFYRVRDIRWCLWGMNIDNELDGNKNRYTRPVVVMWKHRSRGKCFVIPLTSRIDKKDSGYYKYDRGSLSFLDARVVSAKRLLSRKGVMNHRDFEKVKKAFIACVGFNGDDR